MTSSPTRPTRRAAISVACALLAAGSAVTASTLLGAAPPAQADPGDTFVAIGTSRLVESEDLESIQLDLDTETVTLGRDGDYSPCLGEGNPWSAGLPGSPAPIDAVWTHQGDDGEVLGEKIVQAASPGQAKRYARTLVDTELRGCRTPRFDFHYGPRRSTRVGSGHATWALSYPGDARRPDGGVVIIRKGSTVGFLQLSTSEASHQALESVAKVAVARLR